MQSLFELPKKGTKVIHLNIQHISNKHDELKYILGNQDVDIMGLTETFLNKNYPSNLIEINGFHHERKDRVERHGGGILAYIKNGTKYKRRKDLESDNIEALWIELQNDFRKKILLSFIYRPPNSCTDWIELFENMVEKCSYEGKELVLLGDFNIDFPYDTTNLKWSHCIDNLGLTQMVQEPTRVSSNSSTTIDHVYVSEVSLIKKVTVPKIGISDHYPICACINAQSKRQKNGQHITIKYRNMKKFDVDKFLGDLSKVPFSEISALSNPSDMVASFNKLFLNILDKHAPLIEKRVKHYNQPQWMNDEVMTAISKRDKFKAQGNFDQYKFWKRKANLTKINAKKSYFTKNLKENKCNPKQMWKFINELNPKSKKPAPESVSEVKKPDRKSSNVADTFNSYFSSIPHKLLSENHFQLPYNSINLDDYVKTKMPLENSFDIPLVSNYFVHKFLSSLDVNKACGLDEISPKYLKMSANVVSPIITSIINQSILSGIFPSQWKESKITPLHKGGEPGDLNNYRPISILSTLSKVLERHVHDTLYQYFSDWNLFHVFQSGFRPKHSCQTALTKMMDTWLSAINDHKIIGVIFLDFRKAFDVVNHEILLKKLETYGLGSCSLKWFSSYLSDRYQKVSIGPSLSGPEHTYVGVPQGSILGPLLFLIFINDLFLVIKNDIDFFADDSTISLAGHKLSTIESSLQNDLKNIEKWCQVNKMIINVEKTKAMVISTKQKQTRSIENFNLNLFLNDSKLKLVTEQKLLGILVTNTLNWNEHVNHVCKKISKGIFALKKLKLYMDLKTRNLFFNAYILPHFDYCNTIWGHSSSEIQTRMLKLQKKAARYILDVDYSHPSRGLFKTLKWLPFLNRVQFNTAILMYKSVNGQSPIYLKNMFQFCSDQHGHLTRSNTSHNLVPPPIKIELFKHSFTYQGIVLWNSLSLNMKMAPSLSSFKKLYLEEQFSTLWPEELNV